MYTFQADAPAELRLSLLRSIMFSYCGRLFGVDRVFTALFGKPASAVMSGGDKKDNECPGRLPGCLGWQAV